MIIILFAFQVFPHFPYLWVSPLHLAVFTYLAFQEVGWTAFLASGFIVLQVPLQVLFARLFVQFRYVYMYII